MLIESTAFVVVNPRRRWPSLFPVRIQSWPEISSPLLRWRLHYSPAGVRCHRPPTIVSVGRCRRPRRSRPESPATASHQEIPPSSASIFSRATVRSLNPCWTNGGLPSFGFPAFWFQRFGFSVLLALGLLPAPG